MSVASSDIKHWNAKGIGGAALILVAWLTTAVGLIAGYAWVPVWSIPALVILRVFLYTGLFITVHDAIHRSIAPDYPRLNNAFGRAGALLFALMSFKRLASRHHEHHESPGQPEDPDFHGESGEGFVGWLGRFAKNYVTIWQVLGLALVFNVLEHGLGADPVALLLFWVLPSVLSTLQLFTFGTYFPHRGSPDNIHHAQRSRQSVWVSFISCFHFGGFHYEHHEYPWAPWWNLPAQEKRYSELK